VIALSWLMLRATGWPRAALVALSTCFVSAMLLVVVALLRLPTHPAEPLFPVIADRGTRAGAELAGVLVTVPALLLLYQAVRLGSATRDRRLAALRVVGATGPEARVLGAVEVGLPAAVGALLGAGAYGLVQLVLGDPGVPVDPDSDSTMSSFRLLPTSVRPSWLEVLLVVAAVTVVGAAIGWRTSRLVTTTPMAVTRRQARPAPTPWGLVAVAAAALVLFLTWTSDQFGAIVLLGSVAVATLGVTGLAPWLGHRTARLVETRTRSSTMLLAARRVVTDPRAAGRAAAAVGAVALVAGGTGALMLQLVLQGLLDTFFVVSVLLVLLLLAVALLFVCVTMAVHGVESLLERRRETAALVALGMQLEELELSQRFEAALVAMPMAVLGVVLGFFSYAALFLIADPEVPVLVTVALVAAATAVVLVAVLALVWLAIGTAARLVRPWVRRAGEATNLRTE
jgi:NADH:ubiquinone oxidoreductase subunit 3 (subunit A)